MKKCPDCRHVVQTWQVFCPQCSAELYGKQKKVAPREKKRKLLSF